MFGEDMNDQILMISALFLYSGSQTKENKIARMHHTSNFFLFLLLFAVSITISVSVPCWFSVSMGLLLGMHLVPSIVCYQYCTALQIGEGTVWLQYYLLVSFVADLYSFIRTKCDGPSCCGSSIGHCPIQDGSLLVIS